MTGAGFIELSHYYRPAGQPFEQQPLRQVLSTRAWLSGESPAYADYLVFGAFQWARVASRFSLLTHEDPIAVWFERALDLYGGLGRRAVTI